MSVRGTEECDVLVVGAGLAGLQCAGLLTRAGHEVVVLDRANRVGGRVRTDVVDGFTCDRGFQLLNPAYPAVRAHVDLTALRLRPFAAGVAVRDGDRERVLADPRREPGLLPATLRNGLLSPGEMARLARWAAPALGPVERLVAGDDATLAESLDRASVHGPLRTKVLERFLSGVLADDTGEVSAQFVRLLLRSFLLGTPAVPAAGMQALPGQLAGRLATPVRLGVGATAITRRDGGVVVGTAEGDLRARAVVVATDAIDADALLADRDAVGTGTTPMRGLRTWWFATPEPMPSDRLLRVDGAAGPVLNTGALSAVAPEYAPAGRGLVAATTLLPTGVGEREVRAELARLWAGPTDRWELVVRHDVPRALPRQAVPLAVRRPVALGHGLFVAGDHRDTASIQGALVSGRRAADAVAAWLVGGTS